MKKIILTVVTLIVAAALGLYFLIPPIKIGVILSTDTALGSEENKAVRYYQKMHPRIGMRAVEYSILNPKLERKALEEAYDKLAAQGVSFILGGAISKSGTVMAQKAEEFGIPTFGITTSTHTLSGKHDNFYRLTVATDVQAEILADLLKETGYKRLAIVSSTMNKAFADPFAQFLMDEFKGESIQVPFSTGEAVLEQLYAWKPDVTFIILEAPSMIQIIKGIKEKGENLSLISAQWGHAELLTLLPSSFTDGVQAFTFMGPIEGDYVALVQGFENTYQTTATFATGYTFSCLDIVYQAIRDVGADPKALADYFKSDHIFDTAYGKQTVDQYGDSQGGTYYLLEAKDGVFRTLQTITINSARDK